MVSRRVTKRVLLVLVGMCGFCYVWILSLLSQQFEVAIIAAVHSNKQQLLLLPRQPQPQPQHETIQPPAAVPSTTTKHHADAVLTSFWDSNRATAEVLLQRQGPQSVRRILTAYLEPTLNDTIPGTGRARSYPEKDDKSDKGIPPDFYIPLPLRTTTPDDLKVYQYPRVQTCQDLPANFPVDRGLTEEHDPTTGKASNVIRNLLDRPTTPNYPWEEAPFCPVEADPFLPWIHDVFPSLDGSRIEFIAQNRRRCKTGSNYGPDLERLTPQSALLQPVSVQRLSETKAQQLAPSLWRSPSTQSNDGGDDDTPRYRLAPLEEASEDGMWTRFICRFHTTDFATQQSLILEETLSRYPFNYDYVAFRKNRPFVLTPRGTDSNMFWTSTLLFHCPVPTHLQSLVASGNTILSDGTPTLHVDIIPIRTSVRYGGAEAYFNEELAGPRNKWATDVNDKFHKNFSDTTTAPPPPAFGFDPHLRWGAHNVLPRVEASGRWENIPICYPPSVPHQGSSATTESTPGSTTKEVVAPTLKTQESTKEGKPHFLSACLWASATFHERGVHVRGLNVDTETKARLREWIEFHLMVGMDHIYVYDNTGAYTNETSLADVTDQFPPGRVTRIDWPSQVCNNRKPGATNPGERSSQYAAENSCRVRYGPFTEWIASFDTDEYLIPQGNFTSLKDVVRQAHQTDGSNILSFKSARAKLRFDATEKKGLSRVMKANTTFLEAYNCDSVPLPKPEWADRARKQVYRPDYVLLRFVHYSPVTRGLVESYAEYQNRTTPSDGPWKSSYDEPTERLTDELTEAVMIHSKTIDEESTKHYSTKCHQMSAESKRICWVGYPWPAMNSTLAGDEDTSITSNPTTTHDDNGMLYNCYPNPAVDAYWVPRLRRRLGLE